MQNPQLIHSAGETTCFEALSNWQEYVNAYFPTLEISNPSCADFHASASSLPLGDCSLTYIKTTASCVDRTPKLLRGKSASFLKIMWQLSGQVEVTQDRHSVCLAAGGATLCDTTRPYRIRASDGSRHAILLIPYDVDGRLPRYAERICATELTERPLMEATLGAINGLAKSQPAADDHGTGHVMQAVSTMLAAALARAAQPDQSARDNQRLQRAKHYIATHLASTDLTPNRLATAACLSRRSLYSLLARHELTPARLISEIRLQHACNALNATRHSNETITDIALAHGFTDSARFSHAFKKRFGLPPSVWRAKHA